MLGNIPKRVIEGELGMKSFPKFLLVMGAFILLSSCASIGRGWTAGCAENFGADWVIVQYRVDGSPFHCWKLRDASVVNEPHSDGIYWKDRSTSHLVHISGWYNRVQVLNGDYESAGKLLGVTASQCGSGEYPVK